MIDSQTPGPKEGSILPFWYGESHKVVCFIIHYIGIVLKNNHALSSNVDKTDKQESK